MLLGVWVRLELTEPFMTMQPSVTTMKTVTACEQALHLRDIERGHALVARKK